MARYERPEEGEWIEPVLVGYKFACCDCGLVHNIDFSVADDGDPKFRVFRNNRSTGQMRRHMAEMTPEEHGERVIGNYLCLAELPDLVKDSISKRIAFEIRAYHGQDGRES